jgi:predicted nucleotidyltransferase
MATVAIDIPQQVIAEFCQRHHIVKMGLFGSVLRDDFGPASDVDVLVEFDPQHNPGLAFFGMQDELTEILGRQVDMHTPLELSRYFKHVLQEALTIYDAT